jgi:MinD superfamily P-loop ATPase
MREVVVLSGKGGTGKTSVAASLAALAGTAVIADCDVDAADLHLVLSPRIRQREIFKGGHEAIIRPDACIACGACREVCRFQAVRPVRKNGRVIAFSIDSLLCEGCGVCVHACPEQAIDFPKRVCGEWLVSETRFGPMVHAQLAVGAENSGKLVSLVRKEARKIAAEISSPWLVVDGPPGIACPVIASITGASLALLVIEPTLSGAHDVERVLGLTAHFGIPAMICINKWELNPQITIQIEKKAQSSGASLAGRIRYDRAVTDAQVKGVTVVEHGGKAAEDIRQLWLALQEVFRHTDIPAAIQV